MGSTPQPISLRERIAGKWQIPALLVALALFAGSILQIKPAQERLPLDRVIVELEALLDGGLYPSAIDLGQRVLARESDTGARDLGPVHLYVARALLRQAQREDRRTPARARHVIEEFEAARLAGASLTPDDRRDIGEAHEWLGEHAAAVENYEAAIEGSESPSLALRQQALRLRMQHFAEPTEELVKAIDGLIADSQSDPPCLLWAAEVKVNLLLDAGEYHEASSLLESLRPALESTAQQPALEYLLCLTDYRAGRFDEAEAGLRELRNRLAPREETYALCGWLLGQVVLNDGAAQRPEEALSFFRDVIQSKLSMRTLAASGLGMAEALVDLQRFDEAIDHYRDVVKMLPEVEASYMLGSDRVRTSLTVAAERLQRHGRREQALTLQDLATSLVDPENVELLSFYLELTSDTRAALARELQSQARELEPTEETEARRTELLDEARRLVAAAGEDLLRMAKVNTLNEPVSASAAWRAADLFDEAGARERSVALLRYFIRERPNHPLTPRAWVRLGRALQAIGRYEEAVDAYQECNKRFRRTLDANQSLIPLATCFAIMGKDHADEAEKTLRLIVDDSQLFGPEAPEFREALFMLGDLLHREGRYEDAITSLEEALGRYPDDDHAIRGTFLLADSYRLSSLAIKEELTDPRFRGERENMQHQQQERLARAAELFGRLIGQFERRGEASLGEADALYLRHARLYEGDCLFELHKYAEALKVYERAAWIYKDGSASLAAYVQIINCHVFLGNDAEAGAALRRAQYLLKTLPETSFKNGVVPQSREEWKQYFQWIGSSGLF